MKFLNFEDIKDILILLSDLKRWEASQTQKNLLSQILDIDVDIHRPLYLRVYDLNHGALAELCALLWLGRDYEQYSEYDWDSLVQSAIGIDSSYIIEKSETSTYINEGLKRRGFYYDFDLFCEEQDKKKAETEFFSVGEFSKELYSFLKSNPHALYSFTPRRFEELIDDILRTMGFETHLTKQTRDGGRDILAYFSTPLGKFMTIVDCKRYSPERKIGISTVERFLYVLDRKDDASMGMIVTTSSFSHDARGLAQERPFRLKLKDYEDIKDWLDSQGQRYEKDEIGLWLPRSNK